MTAYQETRTTQHEAGQEQRVATFKITQMIWLLLGLLEALLGLRFIFKLIAVNAANPFAALLYKVSDFFVAPFASLAKAPAAGGMVLEVSTILAIIVYLLIGWALERIVYVLFYRPRGPVSVRQTTVAENTPQPQVPFTDSHTTVTERVNTHTTDTL
jgi:YGGT family